MWNFPLLPVEASTTASQVDALFFTLVGISLFFGGIITIGLVYFNIRYRKNSKASRANARHEHLGLELMWSFIPLGISMMVFVWASKVYFDMHVAPPNSEVIYVVAKQWMWKIQHPQGNREINELHIPVGKPIKLVMTSQDVIHSFFVPAFRVKQDVLPDRYTTEWFQATRTGQYHLFCAEYCGTSHASMGGTVYVMDPADYERWLAGAITPGVSMVSSGEQVFRQFGCATCHKQDAQARGPSLHDLFGSKVLLQGGQTIVADQEYIRESILDPTAKVTAGYKPIMPTFKQQINQEQMNQLIEYIKSLGNPKVAQRSGQ